MAQSCSSKSPKVVHDNKKILRFNFQNQNCNKTLLKNNGHIKQFFRERRSHQAFQEMSHWSTVSIPSMCFKISERRLTFPHHRTFTEGFLGFWADLTCSCHLCALFNRWWKLPGFTGNQSKLQNWLTLLNLLAKALSVIFITILNFNLN